MAYKSRELQASILMNLKRYEESFKIFSELREKLERERQHFQYYRCLAVNYSSMAELCFVTKKYHESAKFCRKIFDLERRGLVYPYETAFAHSVMADIYGRNGQINQQLQECWSFLEKTVGIGDENSCMAYTCIMRECG